MFFLLLFLSCRQLLLKMFHHYWQKEKIKPCVFRMSTVGKSTGLCVCVRCYTAWWAVWRGHPQSLLAVSWSCVARTSESSRSSSHRRETVWTSRRHWSGCQDQVCVSLLKWLKVRQVGFRAHRHTLVWRCIALTVSRPLLSETYSELYCLSFNPSVNKEEREESWNFIDLAADYKRMGVPNNLWVATAANSEYRVSLNVTAACCVCEKKQDHQAASGKMRSDKMVQASLQPLYQHAPQSDTTESTLKHCAAQSDSRPAVSLYIPETGGLHTGCILSICLVRVILTLHVTCHLTYRTEFTTVCQCGGGVLNLMLTRVHPFPGVWYIPSRAVCPKVSHACHHCGQLAVQESRTVSSSVLLPPGHAGESDTQAHTNQHHMNAFLKCV